MRLHTESAVTLLGAVPSSGENLEEFLAFAPFLVAADGGAARAIAQGHLPEAVIGDFDSLAEEVAGKLPPDRLIRVVEQETTDFEKCLTRIRAPLILAVGFTGRRLDHELAVYNALVRYPDRRCVVVGAHDIVFVPPPDIALDLPFGSRLSLFPLAPVTGRSEGLRWPIAGLDFRPDGRIGTSNEVTGPVRMQFDAPGMLVITPRAALPAVLAGVRTD